MLAIRIATALAEQKGTLSKPLKEMIANQTAVYAVTKELLSSSPALQPLLGKSDSEKFNVAESSFKVLSHWKDSFASDRKLALKDLNDDLRDKQFFASNEFTLADIILYAILYNVPFGPSDRLEFSNVIRYFDLIQHLIKEVVSIPEIKLTAFDLEFPFVQIVPEKKVKDEKKGDKKDEKKNKDMKIEKKDDKKSEKKNESTLQASLDPSKLDLRVGKILSVERHPEADSLYVETIDLGEESGPRTVVSGLVKFMKESDLLNQYVVLLCNLKPAKMRGIESKAMVLCATSKDGETVEFLQPPANSTIGDKIYFEGFDGSPETLLKPKQKVWEGLQPHLFTTQSKQACFIIPETKKEALMKSSKGNVTIKSVVGAPIK